MGSDWAPPGTRSDALVVACNRCIDAFGNRAGVFVVVEIEGGGVVGRIVRDCIHTDMPPEFARVTRASGIHGAETPKATKRSSCVRTVSAGGAQDRRPGRRCASNDSPPVARSTWLVCRSAILAVLMIWESWDWKDAPGGTWRRSSAARRRRAPPACHKPVDVAKPRRHAHRLPAIVEKVAELFGNVSVERFPIGAHTCPACELASSSAQSRAGQGPRREPRRVGAVDLSRLSRARERETGEACARL